MIGSLTKERRMKHLPLTFKVVLSSNTKNKTNYTSPTVLLSVFLYRDELVGFRSSENIKIT